MGLFRQVLGHAAVYSLSAVFGRLVGLLFLPFYAHIFQAEGYGVMGMIDASVSILAIAFGAGFHLAVLRIYHQEEEARKPLVITTAIRLSWGLGLLVVLTPLAASAWLSKVILGSEQYQVLLVLALIQFVIEMAGQSASTALIIEQRSRTYAAINLVQLGVGVALNIWLVLILQVGLIGVFITALVSAIVSTLLFHHVALRTRKFRYDKDISRSLLSFHLPMLPGELIAFLGRQAERVLVNFMIGIRGVGVLEMAYKFPPLLNFFITFPFILAWRTKSIEIAEQDVDAPRILGRMFTGYVFLMAFCGIGLAVGIDDLLRILTPPDFWPATSIARIEILTTILAGANGFLIFGLVFRKKTQTISTIKGTLAVLKMPLAYLLISSFQLKGAAYSALAAESLLAILLYAKAQQLYRIEYEFRKLIAIVAYGFFVYVIVEDYGLLQLFDWAVAPQGAAAFQEPVTAMQSSRWSRLFQERRADVIRLCIDVLSTSLFLAAAPLLFWKRGKLHSQ